MEFGYGIPHNLQGLENFEDGKDIKMSEVEEGELVEMISKTELGENGGVVSGKGLRETMVGNENIDKKDSDSKNQKRRKNKKKNKKKKNRGNKGPPVPNITDVNRFVIDVCKRLRERKSYLVWTAVACLGVSVLSDLVNEVDAIQASGGQKTSNGQRYRVGGGILWNILRVREPNAFKEIMQKGKEFEKQLKQASKAAPSKQGTKEATNQKTTGSAVQTLVNSSDGSKVPSYMLCNSLGQSNGEPCQSVFNRIRVPVRYDDLYQEEHPKDVQQQSAVCN
ncbi:unnamed protein product [Cuscuta europaea]|uniref:Phosphorylated adapter RNA export protein n=1 Tax=Cuscuta europaea TaxID=41803 RepID=A0A9P1E2U4_CUSEU|nr:unnamed protein product [Cuscuta europaea]